MGNWFIGVVVPPDGWYPEKVPEPPRGFRTFHPDDLHLTVAFLGNVGEERARAAWQALEWPAGPIAAALGDVVPMGAAGRYSALSLLLTTGRAEVEAAMMATREALWAAAEARRDDRPAKAHVTVARPGRTASNTDRKLGLAWAKTVEARDTAITLQEIALYTWAEDRKERLFRKVLLRTFVA